MFAPFPMYTNRRDGAVVRASASLSIDLGSISIDILSFPAQHEWDGAEKKQLLCFYLRNNGMLPSLRDR